MPSSENFYGNGGERKGNYWNHLSMINRQLKINYYWIFAEGTPAWVTPPNLIYIFNLPIEQFPFTAITFIPYLFGCANCSFMADSFISIARKKPPIISGQKIKKKTLKCVYLPVVPIEDNLPPPTPRTGCINSNQLGVLKPEAILLNCHLMDTFQLNVSPPKDPSSFIGTFLLDRLVIKFYSVLATSRFRF